MAKLTLTSERLLLTLPRADQAAAMLDFVSRNRDHLKPWSPPAPDGYTLEFWNNVVSTCDTAFEMGCNGFGRICGTSGYSIFTLR